MGGADGGAEGEGDAVNLPDPFNFTGTLFLLQVHWFWMLVALGLGCWIGWWVADEPEQPVLFAEEAETDGESP